MSAKRPAMAALSSRSSKAPSRSPLRAVSSASSCSKVAGGAACGGGASGSWKRCLKAVAAAALSPKGASAAALASNSSHTPSHSRCSASRRAANWGSVGSRRRDASAKDSARSVSSERASRSFRRAPRRSLAKRCRALSRLRVSASRAVRGAAFHTDSAKVARVSASRTRVMARACSSASLMAARAAGEGASAQRVTAISA